MSEAALSVTGLHKAYPTARGALAVLENLDLSLAAGELVAVVGASGVGKSTLLHVLGTLDPPDRGSYRLGADQPFTLSPDRLADYRNRTIGFVFQFHHLLPEFDAVENVAMPALIGGEAPGPARQRAADLLCQLGLSDRLDHRPAELSGGEQQRVAIARAMVNTPRLLLLDEPTGNLDARTGETVFGLFLELRRQWGTTAILTTHNPTLAEACDRTLQLEEGRLRAT